MFLSVSEVFIIFKYYFCYIWGSSRLKEVYNTICFLFESTQNHCKNGSFRLLFPASQKRYTVNLVFNFTVSLRNADLRILKGEYYQCLN